MKKLVYILLIISVVLSCKKEEPTTTELGFVSVINAVSGYAPPVAVYIDSTFTVRIPFGGSSRNLQLSPGLHILSIRDSARKKTFLTRSPEEFENEVTSTLLVYDTLHPVDSTVRAIRLSDDLTLAPTGFVKVRFLHAAPRLAPVDITFLRTNVTPADSLTFPTQTFVGNNPNIAALSVFENIPIGAYTLKVKAAGTQDTVMNTVKLSVANLAGFAGISGITTMYLTGGVQGNSLRVNLLRHYP